MLPLKDSTSDMAVVARSGSALVRQMREKKDAAKGRARFWEMAGSKMGAVTGLTNEEAVQAAEEEAQKAQVGSSQGWQMPACCRLVRA